MEEIEYLEEYEDIILPNAAKRRRLSEERKSLDSLEVLYKDLIGESPTPGIETVIDSTFPGNVVESTEEASPLVMIDVNLASNLYEKPSTITAPTTYNNATTSTDQLQQPAHKSSTATLLNRIQNKSFSTYSVQRPQLKSVATVKPTLQRHNIPTKQNVYITPTLKTSTGDPTLQSTSVASQANGKMAHGSQSLTNQNKLGPKQTKSSNGLDPLSLEEQDAFLDFDVERAGSVDGFDFDSDFDTGLMSDIDSIDFSDNFSDNFDLDSELSSDGSDFKKLFKKRKVQQESKSKQIAKSEQKNGQTNLKRSKSTQQLKIGTDESAATKKLSPESNLNLSVPKPTITSAIRRPIEKKDSSISLPPSKVNRLVPSEELSKLIAQELQKTSDDSVVPPSTPVTFNSKKTAVLAHCKRMITQLENELNKSTSKSTQKVSKSTDKSKIAEQHSSPDIITKKPMVEQKIVRPTEPVSQKDTPLQQKKPLLKFGSSYLKSIKPPTCTKEKTLKTKVPSDQPKTVPAKKSLGTEDKSPVTKAKTPEPNTSTSFKESKTIFSVGSSSLKHTIPTQPPLARGQTSIKTYLKRKESRESEFSEKSVVVHSFKPQKKHLESLVENGDAQTKNNVTDNKLVSYKVNGSTAKLMEDKTKDSHSSSMQPQQTKSDHAKLQPLPTKFTMRCLRIRINKRTVPQYIKSIKSSSKLKQLDAAKGLENDSAVPSVQKVLSLSTEESASSTEKKICTKPETTAEKASVDSRDQLIAKPSSNADIAASLGKRRRKKFKLSRRPKVLRRSNKPDIDPHQNITERQKSMTAPNESSLQTKEHQNIGEIQKSMQESNEPCSKTKEHQNIAERQKSMTVTNEPFTKTKEPQNAGELQKSVTVTNEPCSKAKEHQNIEERQKSTALTNEPSLKTKEQQNTGELQKTMTMTNEPCSKTKEHQNIDEGQKSMSVTNETCLKTKEHQSIAERHEAPSITVTDEPCSKTKERQTDQPMAETLPATKKPCEEAQVNHLPTTEISPSARVDHSVPSSDEIESAKLKRRTRKKRRFRNLSKSSNEESSVPVTAPVNENIVQPDQETTPEVREEPSEAANACASNEAAAPVSVSTAEQELNQHFEPVEPKTEILNDTIYQFPSINDNATLNSENRATEQDLTKRIAYELPSYIVMRTKIVTRDELKNNTNQVPSVVRQKIDQLAQNRQSMAVCKTETPEFEETVLERPDFKEVCHEINTLLDRNANYLKFASGSERQTRMSQVLADSSLTVVDAQCTLKFLQSYLGLRVKDSPTSRMKNQQFIPIYDSQRKVIGYRKRTFNSKNSSAANENRQLVPNRISILSSSTSSAATVDTNDTLTAFETSSIEKTVVEFTTKKEPVTVDTGDEEMIVPDIAPATSPCIKSETIEI